MVLHLLREGTLLGSIGADRLDGGAGNDVLNGGSMDGARDSFVFAEAYVCHGGVT